MTEPHMMPASPGDGPTPKTAQSTPPSGGPPAGRRWLWRAFWLALLLLVIGGGAAFWLRSTAIVQQDFITVPLQRGDITRVVTATGTVNPELTIVVGSYVSGVIQKVDCDYNTQVRAGQVCAKIDPRPYLSIVAQRRATLGVARAQLEKDRAGLDYAAASNRRNQSLVARQAVSKDAADLTQSEYQQALAQIGLDEATIDLRQAELDAAEVNLSYTDIVAPVDGTVVSRNVTQGQTVTASFQTPTLFIIATDLTRMQVDTNVSESDISGLKNNNPAQFTVDAAPGRKFPGAVRQVRQSPQTVQNVVTYDVVVGVENKDLTLKPGMTASVRIITEQRKNVPRVSNQALRFVPNGQPAQAVADQVRPAGTPDVATERVFVLRAGKVVGVAIEPGLADDNFTEVLKGDLREGDAVITGEALSIDAAPRAGVATPRF